MNKDEFMKRYAAHLDEEQLEAVQNIDGPCLLLAVPGSGKTTVLVTRLGYMTSVCGIASENILTLTYTVAATKDMSNRFAALFGEEAASKLEFRTINGICAKIIARYAAAIGKRAFELVTDDRVTGKILTESFVKYAKEYPTESDIKSVRTLITYAKNMLLESNEIEKLGKKEGYPLAEIYADYNNKLREQGMMDYDDQMIYAYRMLERTPNLLDYYRGIYQYICVDEAQDTSKIQHMIIGLLAGSGGNLFMVGDEDQSIYGFRAAYPDALLNFEQDHPGAKVLVMYHNYRSNATIVNAADAFIQHNDMRHEKHMKPVRKEDAQINYITLKSRASQYSYLVKCAEDAGDSDESTAVLYRDNESILPLVDLLERQNIPYRIKSMDMTFFSHRIVMDVTNIIRFAADPRDTDLFMKIYFKMQTYLKKAQALEACRISEQLGCSVLDALEEARGINAHVMAKCRAIRTHLKNMQDDDPASALYRIEHYMGYGDYLERNKLDDNKIFILRQLAYNESTLSGFLDRLDTLQNILLNKRPNASNFILSTIHSSKGLEYDDVYLIDVCDGVFPDKVVRASFAKDDQDKKTFEEERRLFYVGMTRARNRLNIFKFSDAPSTFVKEIYQPVHKEDKVSRKIKSDSERKPYASGSHRTGGTRVKATLRKS